MIRRNIFHFFPYPSRRVLKSPYLYYRPFSTSKINHYSILGISPTATQAEIKKAYLSKAKQYHPDTQKDPKLGKESEEMFKKVVDAYETLSDEIKRRDYDETLNSSSKSSSAGSGGYGGSAGYQNDSSDFQYPNEKFYGKASAPDVEEDFHRKFHEANKKSRYETEDSFLLRNLDIILMSSLGVILYLKWASVYNQDMANAMAGSRGRIVKTEKESLNPFDNDDEDEMIDVPVPKFDHQRLNFRDCMQLNIEQLEALDRSGYILPNEYKERVLEYREIYHLNHSKNPTIWDYNQRRNAPPPPQETYTGPKFSPNDIYSPQAPPTRPEQRQENLRPVKPWPKGLPRPDQTPPSAENEGTPKPQTITTRQETVVKPSPKVKEEVVEPRPVEKKVGVEANKVEVDEALQYRIPRMRANLYNMDKNK